MALSADQPMETPRCDLVLLSWNHPEVTQPCVKSILNHTTTPSRLIIVDQGSDEQTQAYLKSIRSTPSVAVEILWNPANVGYPKGMNQGLAKAAAPYVCFLNNDILVPSGWLEELIRVAESDPWIGTVNPASNTFGIVPPDGMDWLSFAQRCLDHQDQWTEVKYGEGFCLLSRRDLLLKVGGFDEETYEQIYFEDADLGRKLQALGYRCVMAQGTYVWHHGGQTMETRPERLHLFQENERRFIQRWGRGQRVLFAITDPSPDRLTRAEEIARSEANRSGEVWFLVPTRASVDHLPRHLNIRIHRCPSRQLALTSLWKALTKKKKFERIVTDSKSLSSMLAPLRFLHRATVESF